MFTYSSLVAVNNSYEHLLSMIEDKIFTMAATELDSIRFGIDSTINWELYDDLDDYRDIIVQKSFGCNCLDGVPMDVVASRIRKLVKTC